MHLGTTFLEPLERLEFTRDGFHFLDAVSQKLPLYLQQGFLHYTPEHCNLKMVVALYLGVEKATRFKWAGKMEIFFFGALFRGTSEPPA